MVGCADVPVSPDRYYRLLHDGSAAEQAAPVLDGTLLVKRFRADGVLAQRPIVWTDASSPRELQQYHYHFWNDPPPVLVQELAVDVLRAGGAARRVIEPGMEAEADYVLVGRIRRLEHLVGREPGVAVSLELALRRSDPPQLLMLERLEGRRPLQSPGVAPVVEAMNGVLLELLQRFLTALRRR
jgi:ABC-type uncharacterized transport system auxiliary subunit